jgi:hypothetical protein
MTAYCHYATVKIIIRKDICVLLRFNVGLYQHQKIAHSCGERVLYSYLRLIR